MLGPTDKRRAILLNALVQQYRHMGLLKSEQARRYRAAAAELKANQAHENRIFLNQNFVGTQRIRSQLRW